MATNGAAAVLLAGCSQLTLEEAQAASHRVVETGHDFWAGESWSYIGTDRRGIVPLARDGVCQPAAGQIHFSPSCIR